jgi:tetratricopeptide (TPR) repeat protein
MERRVRPALCTAMFLGTMILTDRLAAQSSKEWAQCTGREDPITDVIIEGCTAVIRAGKDTPAKLASAFNNRGVAYRYKGEYERALEDYNEAIRLNPNDASHYNNRGIVYRMKGEYDRAISDYDEAIWLKSDYPAAFYNRAIAYTEKGEYDNALADFDIVLRFDARNAFALYGRGMARLKKGEMETGSADIAAANAINPHIAKEFEPASLH